MQSASHTPGPWSACKQGSCECGFIWSGCGNIHVASAHGEADLGQSWFGGDACADRPSQEANARLIAAAPDLLAALKLWQAYDDQDEADFNEVGPMLLYAKAIDATRAAIAKAEARS